MIDQPTIDRILDAANIVDVVSEFVTLRKRGINYVGLCPFHSDKSPSFYVSPAKNICKCFACGEGGTAVHFIMKHEQLSYYDALRFLAKKYNIEIQPLRFRLGVAQLLGRIFPKRQRREPGSDQLVEFLQKLLVQNCCKAPCLFVVSAGCVSPRLQQFLHRLAGERCGQVSSDAPAGENDLSD